MHKIIFISTVHKEIGKANANELCIIIEEISPEIIFLEAINNTYSDYDKIKFETFGVYHTKLEIEAIQKYNSKSLKYFPVLDNELPDTFETKYNMICENRQFHNLLDNFNSLVGEQGFQFLNSSKSIQLQEEMRLFENTLLDNSELTIKFNEDIDTYENSMLQNIYSYCRANRFDTAIFMCGVAHRKSIIEKIERFNYTEGVILNWSVFEN